MRAKVSIAQADEMRARMMAGETEAAVARDYGVAQSTAGRIKHGQRSGLKRKTYDMTLTPAQVRRLRDAFADGVTVQDLAGRFGLCGAVVVELARGATP